MKKNRSAIEYEENFKYGKGLLPMPQRWLDYFWRTHQLKTVRLLQPYVAVSDTILFIGVGSGDVLPYLDLKGKTVYGTEVNTELLKTAENYCIPVVSDGTILPFKTDSIDLVVCNMVLHHIIGQGIIENVLTECRRVLKVGCPLLAFEPNAWHPSGIMLNIINKFHLYHKIGGGSDYEYALSPSMLKTVLSNILFSNIMLKVITFGHPRIPVFMQKAFMNLDDLIPDLYLPSFTFMISGTKTDL